MVQIITFVPYAFKLIHMRKNFWMIVCIVLLFSACQKDDTLSSAKQILSFSIQQQDNQGKIGKDAEVELGESVITLSVSKYDDLKSLIATFTFDGIKITVGGTEQTSGVTSNDYSNPLTFTVEARNGSKKEYTVKVVLKETQVISKFGFLKENNGLLASDVMCSVIDKSITTSSVFPCKKLTPIFGSDAVKVLVGGVEQLSGVTENDFSSPVTYHFVMRNGETVDYVVALDYVLTGIPQFKIVTDDPFVTEIPGKDDYLNATLTVEGQGVYDDYVGKTQIKGRGNSTWGYPKKPYRLKLDKKSGICGFGKAKNFVLLANYLDPTLMLNSVAFKIGQLLGLPFTNHAIPVDVTLNNQYKGSYLLTEQVEIYESRVNISETEGIIWELDSYFDEDPKFKSSAFNLPVMLKDPDMDDSKFNTWKKDFNAFVEQFGKEPLEGNKYVDLIDIESVANYLIVFNLTQNMEINHPKSVFIHKEGTGKYVMGPIWDFDWAFGYEGSNQHFMNATRPLFDKNMGGGIGQGFFERFLNDSRVKAIYKKNWTRFRNGDFQRLIQYIDAYAKVLKPSVERDSKEWSNTRSFDEKVGKLKTWLNDRANYIDKQVTAY